MRQEGNVPIPRTCPECGLGPCKYRYQRAEIVLTVEQNRSVRLAERIISETLILLEQRLGLSIGKVEVDTRNFSGLATDITLTNERRQ
jgi:hypothetical protein